MSELTICLHATPVNTAYTKKDATVSIVQAASGKGYAVFNNKTLVYITEDYDELTHWIMKDLGFVDYMESLGLRLYEKGDYSGALIWLEKSDTFNKADFFEELNEKIAEQKNKATYELKKQKNIQFY